MKEAQVCDEGKLFSIFLPYWNGEVSATDIHGWEEFSAVKVVQAVVDATERVIVTDTIVVQLAQRTRDLVTTVWFLDQKSFVPFQ